MKTDDAFLKNAVSELVTKYKCHTVVLYGSRARGDFSTASDYDLMGIRKGGKKYRLAEQRPGGYLDIFIYPEADLKRVDERHLYMEGAKVLFEKKDFGAKLLGKLKTALGKKYVPLPNDEIKARKVWLHKMLERGCQGDIEGNYRRLWLLEALLPDYFNIRRMRYWGSKRSLQWLRENDGKTYRCFEQAYRKPMDQKSLKKLVERVSGNNIK